MFEQYSTEPSYNVKAIVMQTGVAAATLRAWERRYGVPAPPRTDSGYRLYSARDMAVIRWLKSQIDAGMSISHAIALMQAQMRRGETGPESQPPQPETPDPESAPLPPASTGHLRNTLIHAAAQFDESAVERVFSEAFSLHSVEDVCTTVIQPALAAIGARWHAGELSIGVEHFATNLVRRKLGALLAAAPAPVHTEKIVAACAPGEQHEIGLLITSLFLRRLGHPVVYLGQDTPLKRLHETLSQTSASVLLLSATHLVAAAQMLSLIDGLSGQTDQLFAVVYGGRIFNLIPALRERVPAHYVGVNAFEAAQQIVKLARQGQKLAQPEHRTQQELLQLLRQRQPEIVHACSRAIANDPVEFNTHAPKFERAMTASQNLCQVFEAAVAFDLPSVLAERAFWDWDSPNSEGILTAQLRVCATSFAASVLAIMPADQHDALKPYLSSLLAAVGN